MARKNQPETLNTDTTPDKATRAVTTKKKRAAKAESAAETPVEPATAEPDKPPRRKRTATLKVAPDAPVAAAAAPPVATPVEAPKPDLVVFAFRLSQAERDAIHQTAGPRNATQFVRRIAAAFASEDEAAFRAVITEARTLRS